MKTGWFFQNLVKQINLVKTWQFVQNLVVFVKTWWQNKPVKTLWLFQNLVKPWCFRKNKSWWKPGECSETWWKPDDFFKTRSKHNMVKSLWFFPKPGEHLVIFSNPGEKNINLVKTRWFVPKPGEHLVIFFKTRWKNKPGQNLVIFPKPGENLVIFRGWAPRSVLHLQTWPK